MSTPTDGSVAPEDLLRTLAERWDDVVPKPAWGETTLFVNPGDRLPHGVYFATVKLKDGKNDTASGLDRDGVWRFSLGLPLDVYRERFGRKPRRPGKGQIVDTGHDFRAIDELMPHPIYAWMGWVQILSPSADSLRAMEALIDAAHARAVERYEKRMKERR